MAVIRKPSSKETLEVVLDPKKRKSYLRTQLKMDGLYGLVKEDTKAAYCAIALTNTPDAAKPYVKQRQKELQEILASAGVSSYDPGTAPLSPDLNLTAMPEEIYRTDLARVAGARFFVAFDTFPSIGMGVEMEAARRYNRIAVILHDESIRTSRMQPSCAIHLTITNLTQQTDQVKQLFEELLTYEPGRGLQERQPILLGYKDGKQVNLAKVVAKKFPELQYSFDGTKPAVQFTIVNHEVLFFAEEFTTRY